MYNYFETPVLMRFLKGLLVFIKRKLYLLKPLSNFFKI